MGRITLIIFFEIIVFIGSAYFIGRGPENTLSFLLGWFLLWAAILGPAFILLRPRNHYGQERRAR